MEFNFITGNDIHISDKNPRARLDNFKETILGKIDQMRQWCEKVKADGALIAGDLYNFKAPIKNSHRLNQDLIKYFSKFPCPVYMIEGNHDLTSNRLESLDEQPLGVLFASGTLIQLRHKVIEKEGFKVSIVGIPYNENLDLDTLKIPENKGYASQICLLHTHASLTSGMIYNDRLWGYNELAKLSPNIFVLGHYHIDQGIYEFKKGDKYFISVGSICRGSLSDDNIEHHPQIGHINIKIDNEHTEYKIESIKLKVRPANEIFDLTKKEEEKKENEEIKNFVEKLASEANDVRITNKDEDLNSKINQLDLTQIIKDRTLHYLQEARQLKKCV